MVGRQSLKLSQGAVDWHSGTVHDAAGVLDDGISTGSRKLHLDTTRALACVRSDEPLVEDLKPSQNRGAGSVGEFGFDGTCTPVEPEPCVASARFSWIVAALA